MAGNILHNVGLALCSWLLTARMFVGCHSENEIIFCCDEDNDLYQFLKSAGKKFF
jgi:hypothetical protein